MMEDTRYITYSAGPLRRSYDSPSQSPYMNAPMPCSALTAVPVYPNFPMPDQSQVVVGIHPDEMIGSNTEAPPEIAVFVCTTPHDILSQLQEMRFKSASFSAPSTPPSQSYAYLPPRAFHTKPPMTRSSNIPASQSAVPTLKTEYEDPQMIADQSSYVFSGYEILNDKLSETFLQPQPQPQGFVSQDAYSVMSNNYASPSFPITPPPNGTFRPQSLHHFQQQEISANESVGMPAAGPVPMSSPSISGDGGCILRSHFVNQSTTPPTMTASPEEYALVQRSDDADAMEDVTPSNVEPKEDIPSPEVASLLKAPTLLKTGSVATPPRRRQASAMTRKSSAASGPEQSTAQTSRASSVKAETAVPSPKTTGRQTGSIRSRKRKARVSSRLVLPSDPAKVFICDVLGCEKRFRRSEHLKRHQRSLHTLEKPYVCNQPNCNQKFSRSDNLNQHLRVHKRNSTEGEGPAFVDEEEVPPSLVKPKRRRGGPKRVGIAAPKRSTRAALSPKLRSTLRSGPTKHETPTEMKQMEREIKIVRLKLDLSLLR